MKGKATFELNGETQNLPFEAKRVVAAKPNPVGDWKLSIEVQGQTYEYTMKLKMDGAKLTGTMVAEDGKESKLGDTTFKNGVLTCKIAHEVDGEKLSVKATATISGDTMKGKAAFESRVDRRTCPLKANAPSSPSVHCGRVAPVQKPGLRGWRAIGVPSGFAIRAATFGVRTRHVYHETSTSSTNTTAIKPKIHTAVWPAWSRMARIRSCRVAAYTRLMATIQWQGVPQIAVQPADALLVCQ